MWFSVCINLIKPRRYSNSAFCSLVILDKSHKNPFPEENLEGWYDVLI